MIEDHEDLNYLIENGDIRNDILNMIKEFNQKVFEYPHFKTNMMIPRPYDEFSLKAFLDKDRDSMLKDFQRNITKTINFIQNNMFRDFTYVVLKLKAYPNASKKILLDLLRYLIETSDIGGFSKAKYDLHITDFTSYSEDKIRDFLIQKNIDAIIQRYEKGNTVVKELLDLSEALYLKIYNIRKDDWDSSAKKSKRMIEIYKRFQAKNLVRISEANDKFNSIGFGLEHIQIPQKYLRLLGYECEKLTRYYLYVYMFDNQYVLQTYNKEEELTDELIDFLLSF